MSDFSEYFYNLFERGVIALESIAEQPTRIRELEAELNHYRRIYGTDRVSLEGEQGDGTCENCAKLEDDIGRLRESETFFSERCGDAELKVRELQAKLDAVKKVADDRTILDVYEAYYIYEAIGETGWTIIQ